MKLVVGQTMPNFTIDTVFERGISLKKMVGDMKTALIFLRYAGCTLCQLDMMILNDEYEKIRKTGGQAVVVLQSDPGKLAKNITKDTFPYDIICDPNQIMYKTLDIRIAKTVDELISGKTKEKIEKLKDTDLKHGEYEGEELQLPATFVIDKNLIVGYAHYGENAADIPSAQELSEILMN